MCLRHRWKRVYLAMMDSDVQIIEIDSDVEIVAERGPIAKENFARKRKLNADAKVNLPKAVKKPRSTSPTRKYQRFITENAKSLEEQTEKHSKIDLLSISDEELELLVAARRMCVHRSIIANGNVIVIEAEHEALIDFAAAWRTGIINVVRCQNGSNDQLGDFQPENGSDSFAVWRAGVARMLRRKSIGGGVNLESREPMTRPSFKICASTRKNIAESKTAPNKLLNVTLFNKHDKLTQRFSSTEQEVESNKNSKKVNSAVKLIQWVEISSNAGNGSTRGAGDDHVNCANDINILRKANENSCTGSREKSKKYSPSDNERDMNKKEDSGSKNLVCFPLQVPVTLSSHHGFLESASNLIIASDKQMKSNQASRSSYLDNFASMETPCSSKIPLPPTTSRRDLVHVHAHRSSTRSGLSRDNTTTSKRMRSHPKPANDLKRKKLNERSKGIRSIAVQVHEWKLLPIELFLVKETSDSVKSFSCRDPRLKPKSNRENIDDGNPIEKLADCETSPIAHCISRTRGLCKWAKPSLGNRSENRPNKPLVSSETLPIADSIGMLSGICKRTSTGNCDYSSENQTTCKKTCGAEPNMDVALNCLHKSRSEYPFSPELAKDDDVVDSIARPVPNNGELQIAETLLENRSVEMFKNTIPFAPFSMPDVDKKESVVAQTNLDSSDITNVLTDMPAPWSENLDFVVSCPDNSSSSNNEAKSFNDVSISNESPLETETQNLLNSFVRSEAPNRFMVNCGQQFDTTTCQKDEISVDPYEQEKLSKIAIMSGMSVVFSHPTEENTNIIEPGTPIDENFSVLRQDVSASPDCRLQLSLSSNATKSKIMNSSCDLLSVSVYKQNLGFTSTDNTSNICHQHEEDGLIVNNSDIFDERLIVPEISPSDCLTKTLLENRSVDIFDNATPSAPFSTPDVSKRESVAAQVNLNSSGISNALTDMPTSSSENLDFVASFTDEASSVLSNEAKSSNHISISNESPLETRTQNLLNSSCARFDTPNRSIVNCGQQFDTATCQNDEISIDPFEKEKLLETTIKCDMPVVFSHPTEQNTNILEPGTPINRNVSVLRQDVSASLDCGLQLSLSSNAANSEVMNSSCDLLGVSVFNWNLGSTSIDNTGNICHHHEEDGLIVNNSDIFDEGLIVPAFTLSDCPESSNVLHNVVAEPDTINSIVDTDLSFLEAEKQKDCIIETYSDSLDGKLIVPAIFQSHNSESSPVPSSNVADLDTLNSVENTDKPREGGIDNHSEINLEILQLPTFSSSHCSNSPSVSPCNMQQDIINSVDQTLPGDTDCTESANEISFDESQCEVLTERPKTLKSASDFRSLIISNPVNSPNYCENGMVCEKSEIIENYHSSKISSKLVSSRLIISGSFMSGDIVHSSKTNSFDGIATSDHSLVPTHHWSLEGRKPFSENGRQYDNRTQVSSFQSLPDVVFRTTSPDNCTTDRPQKNNDSFIEESSLSKERATDAHEADQSVPTGSSILAIEHPLKDDIKDRSSNSHTVDDVFKEIDNVCHSVKKRMKRFKSRVQKEGKIPSKFKHTKSMWSIKNFIKHTDDSVNQHAVSPATDDVGNASHNQFKNEGRMRRRYIIEHGEKIFCSVVKLNRIDHFVKSSELKHRKEATKYCSAGTFDAIQRKESINKTAVAKANRSNLDARFSNCDKTNIIPTKLCHPDQKSKGKLTCTVTNQDDANAMEIKKAKLGHESPNKTSASRGARSMTKNEYSSCSVVLYNITLSFSESWCGVNMVPNPVDLSKCQHILKDIDKKGGPKRNASSGSITSDNFHNVSETPTSHILLKRGDSDLSKHKRKRIKFDKVHAAAGKPEAVKPCSESSKKSKSVDECEPTIKITPTKISATPDKYKKVSPPHDKKNGPGAANIITKEVAIKRKSFDEFLIELDLVPEKPKKVKSVTTKLPMGHIKMNKSFEKKLTQIPGGKIIGRTAVKKNDFDFTNKRCNKKSTHLERTEGENISATIIRTKEFESMNKTSEEIISHPTKALEEDSEVMPVNTKIPNYQKCKLNKSLNEKHVTMTCINDKKDRSIDSCGTSFEKVTNGIEEVKGTKISLSSYMQKLITKNMISNGAKKQENKIKDANGSKSGPAKVLIKKKMELSQSAERKGNSLCAEENKPSAEASEVQADLLFLTTTSNNNDAQTKTEANVETKKNVKTPQGMVPTPALFDCGLTGKSQDNLVPVSMDIEDSESSSNDALKDKSPETIVTAEVPQLIEVVSSSSSKSTNSVVDEGAQGKPRVPREFLSTDPAENADNNDPAWKELQKVSSDVERYRKVRKRWLNLVIPDPNKDLTYRHRYSKQPAGLEATEVKTVKRHNRSKSCTSYFEKIIENVSERHNERMHRIKKLQEHDEANLYLNNSNWGANFERELYRMKSNHDRRTRELSNELNATTRKYENYISEIRIFQKFYQGLVSDEDKTLLTDEQEELFDESIRMYKAFDEIYDNH